MRIDYVLLGLLGLLVGIFFFAGIMFLVIRKQSQKSEHLDAQLSNASNPTLLRHAPPDSQSAYSASMLSLRLGKAESAEATEKTEGEEKKFKKRLFNEDTGEERGGLLGRRGSQIV